VKDKELRKILSYKDYEPPWRIKRLELIVEKLLEMKNLKVTDKPLINDITLEKVCPKCKK